MYIGFFRDALGHPAEAATGETFAQRWGRRCLSIGLVFLACVIFTAALPLLLPLVFILGRLHRGLRAAWRVLLLIELVVVCEAIGIVASFGLWLRHRLRRDQDPARFLRENFALQCWWGSTLARLGMRLFKLRLNIERPFQNTRRPNFFLVRHVSFVDALLPVLLLSAPHGIRLRYVLKRELLWDPCLDIVGNRLPNHFVRRGGDDRHSELRCVAQLTRDLGPDEGVLIFPEGTRFSETRRARRIEKYARAGDTEKYEQAVALKHVLPPKHGGVLALFENNPGADVTLCAHAGLEDAFTLRSVLNGGIVGRTLHLRFTTIPFADLPRQRDARIAWLAEAWSGVDAFVARHRRPQD